MGVADRFTASLPDEVDPTATYDEIWSNPPIRIGKPALHALLLRWLPRLAPGGRAVMVVGKNLGADSLQRWLVERGWPTERRASRAGYRLLGLQTYFTAGKQEVRAWTIPIGATAPKAAGVIHTDFEKGFIRAEVTGYDDFIAGNGEQGAKDAGKWRLEGKDYVVKDGDVVHFRFNV